MLADEYILSFISLLAYIQPTNKTYQLLLLSSSSFFQSAVARAGHYIILAFCNTWPVMLS